MTDPYTGQTVPRFRFDGTVNMATILTLGSMAVGGVIWINSVSQKTDAMAVSFADRVAAANVREADQEGRLRSLELAQGRTDEKFNAILDTMRRIEQRLEGQP